MNSLQPVWPGVAKENEKKRRLTGQFDQKKRLRHRDEGRYQKRNWKMPEKLRTNRIARRGQRKNKRGNAAKPGNARNGKSNPWQMDDPTLGLIEFFRRDRVAFDQFAINSAQGKDDINPDRDRHRINRGIVKNYCRSEAMPQFFRHQQWRDDDGVVPNVERASEHLRDDRREGGDEKAVAARARRKLVCHGIVHGRK